MRKIIILSLIIVASISILLFVINFQPPFDGPSDTVGFSLPAGAYSGASIKLKLYNSENYPIYYTTDGSDPTLESAIYTDSITITEKMASLALEKFSPHMYVNGYGILPNNGIFPKAVIIRAAAQMPDGSLGPTVTNTYFVKTNLIKKYNHATVISLVTNPDNLFDYEYGILVKGQKYEDHLSDNELAQPWEAIANYSQKGKEWERPATIQIFDDSNKITIEAPCGIRVHGSASRVYSQRSFNIYFRKKYGQKNLSYNIIPNNKDIKGDNITTYDSFVLRNGGNDTEYLKFKDAAIQSLLEGQNYTTQKSRLAILFINGEYYGVFNLTEKYTDTYIESHYGINADNVVIFKEGELEEGNEDDTKLYDELMSYVNKNMKDASVWESFQQIVDVDSMAAYYASEIYIGNADWDEISNYQLWRSRTADGTAYGDAKWRWMLYDTEYSTYLYNQPKTAPDFNTLEYALTSGLFPLFSSVIKNDSFKKLFIAKLDNLTSTLSPSNVKQTIEKYFEEWQPFYDDYRNRFITSSGCYEMHQCADEVVKYFSNRVEMIEVFKKDISRID